MRVERKPSEKENTWPIAAAAKTQGASEALMSYGGWGGGRKPYNATDDVQVGNNVSVHVGDTVDSTEGEVDEDATHSGQKTLCSNAEGHGSKRGEEKKWIFVTVILSVDGVRTNGYVDRVNDSDWTRKRNIADFIG